MAKPPTHCRICHCKYGQGATPSRREPSVCQMCLSVRTKTRENARRSDAEEWAEDHQPTEAQRLDHGFRIAEQGGAD